MGFGLLNSVFVWGFLAIGIPIIIHLFFKRQYRQIQWAAIQFLLEAEKRIRKKLKLIEILMLLLRCTAIFLLVLLFGKIFLDKSGIFSRPFGGKPVFYHIVLDDSPSMNYVENDSTPFKKSILSINNLAKRLSDKNEETFFSLYLTSNVAKPIFKKVLLNHDALIKIEKFLETVTVCDAPLNPELCFVEIKKAIDQLEQGNEPHHHILRFYSDFRDSDWSEVTADQIKNRFASLLKGYDNLTFVDSSIGKNFNIGVTNVSFSEKKIVKNVQMKFYVEVANYSSTHQKNIEVFMIPPNGVNIKKNIRDISPGSKEIVSFTYTFNQAGVYDMKWSIHPDDLLEDNSKNVSVDVVDGNRILLVDGDIDKASNQSETKFLLTALMPPGDTFSGNRVERKTESDFEISSIDDYDVIYICNLYRILPQNLQQLSAWVARGGSLIFALGDQIDASYYNEFLYNSGNGIFPCKLDKINILKTDERAQLTEVNFSHPIFKGFSGDANKFILNANFFGWWKVDLESLENCKILAYFKSEEKMPAIIEKQHEKGRVFLFTSSVDDDWNSWPSEFSYLITHLELIKYCLNDEMLANQFIAGEKIKMNLSSNRFKNKILYTDPVSKTQLAIRPNLMSSEEFELNFSDTFKAGFYHFELLSTKDHKENKSFAVNAKPDEGNPDKGLLQSVLKKISLSNVNYIESSKDSSDDESKLKNELWKTVLAALIGVLFLETIAGWYFGGKR